MQLSSGARYILEYQIAEGGMGAVYRGTLQSAAGKRTVAIKRLLATNQVSADATRRLTNEARLVFRLNHANVCQVLDLGSDGNEIYVIMEYVHGLDLGALLRWRKRAGGPLDIAHAIYIAREVARALDYAHRRTGDDGALLGLVHGDVTPPNILLSVEGEVKLSDFGIARAAVASPGNQLRGGTPGYMAPEAERATIDHRADLYSLGATLWAALSGRRPQRTIDVAALDARAGISPELRALIANLVDLDPARRPVSAAAVEASLATELSRRYPGFTPGLLGALVATAATGDTVVDRPALGTLVSIVQSEEPEGSPSTHTLDPAPRRRTLWPIAVLAAAAAIAVAVGVFLSGNKHAVAPSADANRVVMSAAEHADASIAESVTPDAAATDKSIPNASVAVPEHKHPVHRPDLRATAVRKREPDLEPGLLTVTSEPWGAVYVDGTRVASETPAYRLRTKPGVHEVKVFYPDSGTYSPTRTVTVVSGKVVAVGFKHD